MKRKTSVIIFTVTVCITAVLFIVFGKEGDNAACRSFLESFGWETEKDPCDSEQVNIPNEFDRIYESYNEVQKNAGLDLIPYRGRSGMRYTYVVTNYPIDTGQIVYANVICIDGMPVAGDIMTAGINGFMHSLDRR